MGTDLYLKTKCQKCGDMTLDVAWLGRAYHYIDLGEAEPIKVVDEIDSRIKINIERLKSDVIKQLYLMRGLVSRSNSLYSGYHSAADMEKEIATKVDNIIFSIEEDLKEYAYEFVELGQRRVVADMLADEDGIFTELS